MEDEFGPPQTTSKGSDRNKERGPQISHNSAADGPASTYFEYVKLIHNALPEINLSEVDLSTRFLNHNFSAPIIMDGSILGAPEDADAAAVLAQTCEHFGIGLAVAIREGWAVREELAENLIGARRDAPNTFIALKVGATQLMDGVTLEDVKKLLEMANADALSIYLDALHRVIQDGGGAMFKGVLGKITELVSGLRVPVIIEETGAGISREVALRLEMVGVSAIGVSAARGGTSSDLEQSGILPTATERRAGLLQTFRDWGIPTAASLLEVKRSVKLPIISSGGIKDGLDVAKCLVLGAVMCEFSPMHTGAAGAKDALFDLVSQLLHELRIAMFLVGARNIAHLKQARHIISGPLADWVRSL